MVPYCIVLGIPFQELRRQLETLDGVLVLTNLLSN